MHTNFGECGLSSFGDIAAKFPFRTMLSKKFNQLESALKFMQVVIDVKCMHTSFGEHGLSGFVDIATFKNGQFSLSNHGL